MGAFDRELSPLRRRATPSVATLLEVGTAMFPLMDLDGLGPPHFEEKDVEGFFKQHGLPPGPERAWWLEARCGLEFALSQDFSNEVVTVIAEETAEFEHVLAHLPFAAMQPHRWAPEAYEEARRRGRGGWMVLRIDEHGNTFEVTSLSRERSARCFAALLELRGHKQTYVVEARGALPPTPHGGPGHARWVLVRQDDNGVRYEVDRSAYRARLAWLAEQYNLEPRHKQTWLVESIDDPPPGRWE
jgi:hypothetical protein